MPSMLHQGLVGLFLYRPELAIELLNEMRVELPAHTKARIVSAAVTELKPADRDADVVAEANGKAVQAVVVEVQLEADPEKHFSWPVYVAGLRTRHRCPAFVLAVTVSETMAMWCRTRFDLGGSNFFGPVVLAPSAVPAIDDEATARQRPELAVLSCIAHAGEPDALARGRATLAAVRDLPGEKPAAYSDLVLVAYEKGARAAFEELMMSDHYEFQSDFARKYAAQGKAEGEAHGRAEALLAVLESRRLHVPHEVRHRVLACTDNQQLDAWIRAAVSVASVDELF